MHSPAPRDVKDLIELLSGEPGWVTRTTDMITAAIVAELPAIAAEPDSRPALHESVAANLRLTVEMIRTGMPSSEAQPPPAATAYAREFVRLGMPIDALLRAYFVGHATFFGQVQEEIDARISDPRAAAATLEELASWSFGFIGALTRGIVERYGDERERWLRSSAAVKAALVEEILAGGRLDTTAVSARLHYRLDRSHLAFAVWSEAAGTIVDPAACERVAAGLGARLGTGDPLLISQGVGLVSGWLGAPDPLPEPIGALEVDGLGGPAHVRIAFGTVAPGVEGFRASHLEAIESRRVAMLLDPEGEPIVSYSDLALPALASLDPDRTASFCRRELGPLLADDARSRRLRTTLLAYLDSGSSARRTAARLGLHENTVVNHVRAAEQMLGGSAGDRVGELIVALRLAPLASRPRPRDLPHGTARAGLQRKV